MYVYAQINIPGGAFAPVPSSRFGECQERMDAGLLRVEFETYGRIVPIVKK